jgi:glycosyltransferase involved in cell wall biosynthesis
MKASVIIPTRDRSACLDDCLRSIGAQTLPPDRFEVIVVDNGSSDDTAAVAAKHGTVLPLRCLHEPEPGLHAGRHAGLRAASGELLVYADDDIVADPGWLAAIVDAFSDPDVVMVGGNNRPLFEAPPPDWLVAWWARPRRHGRALGHLSILDFGTGRFDIDPGLVWGCNYSIRRETLLAAGGFHPDGMPRDRLRWRGDGETHVSEWVRRSGLRARFDGAASVGHRVPAARMTPEYFQQRGFAQGISESFADLRRRGGRSTSRSARALRRIGEEAAALAAPLRYGTGLADVVRATQRARRNGYHFHQAEVASDPALRDWVMREDYF